MRLRDITSEDPELDEALLTDPATMAELGGPLTPDGLADKLPVMSTRSPPATWYFAS